MRVFLDTNVLVAAFATRGLCADILRYVVAEHELVTAEVVLEELDKVLSQKIGLPRKDINDITAFLCQSHVEPRPQKRPVFSDLDPDDAWVVASALSSKADVIVTGDKEMLSVRGRFPIIMTDPRGFWNMVKGSQKK